MSEGRASEQGHLIEVTSASDGLESVHLIGDEIEVVVVPGAGGKISRIVHRASGFNVLWENPRVPVCRTYPGAPFDDVWSGGWDDIFPTDPPCEYDGGSYHDHGDLWIGEWNWSIEEDSFDAATIHLSRDSVSLPCRVDKWIRVERGSPRVTARLRLTNSGLRPVTFMWNQHIAHAIGPGSRVHAPASRMNVVAPAPSLGDATSVDWPVHDGRDLSILPGPDAGTLEFIYPVDLRAGWCAVTHPSHGLAVRVEFDPEVFRTPWQWRVCGGWRGHYFLLTEPCTSRPGSLADAVANSSAAVLDAESSIDTELVISVFTSFDEGASGDVDPTL